MSLCLVLLRKSAGILTIFIVGNRSQVARINAVPLLAEMVYFFFRIWRKLANMQLPRSAVGGHRLAVHYKPPISVSVFSGLPDPAWRYITSIFLAILLVKSLHAHSLPCCIRIRIVSIARPLLIMAGSQR